MRNVQNILHLRNEFINLGLHLFQLPTCFYHLGASKYPLAVTLETTLSKSMKEVSLDREGILLFFPSPSILSPSYCSLSDSLFLSQSLPPLATLLTLSDRLLTTTTQPFCAICRLMEFTGKWPGGLRSHGETPSKQEYPLTFSTIPLLMFLATGLA